MKSVCLVTYIKDEIFSAGVTENEDELLAGFLRSRGFNVGIEIWNDPEVDWNTYDAVIIKSPWDYHNHVTEFVAWIKRLEASGVLVLNNSAIVEWNSHKKYLLDIAASGLPVIATTYLQRGTGVDWHSFFSQWNTDTIIVKPCESAGAKNTLKISTASLSDRLNVMNSWVKNADYLVQPYMKEIEKGELSLLFFGGSFSHAVLKIPKHNDFRVQHTHGGTFAAAKPTDSVIQTAKEYVDRFAAEALYARVDGVVTAAGFVLMEIELIEPYLFLSVDTNAIHRYHHALVARLNRNI